MASVPRLQDLARQSVKRQIKDELKSQVSPRRKSELKEISDLMATMKLTNRTTRTEEKQLREKSLARKVINKMSTSRTFTGRSIRMGYPFITEYKVGTTKFRLTSNDPYYTNYTKPDLLKSVVKRGNKITMELDCYKIRDCSLSRHIIIDIPTKKIIYYIIRENPDYNVIEEATDNKIKFELIP